MSECRKCGQPAAAGKKSCNSCLSRKRQQNKKRRQALIDAGRCSSCGSGSVVVGRKTCKPCQARSKSNSVTRRRACKATGRCVACGFPTDKKLCKPCQDKKVVSERARRDSLRSQGKCVWCTGERDTPKGSLCSYCCLKGAARSWLDGAHRADDLKQLLEDQNFKCPYTGRSLEIGRNAVIDHINPRSRGGGGDLKNLQWVDDEVNRAKTSMTHEEFIALCRLVVSRADELDQSG